MKKILILTQNYYPEIGSAANRMKNIYIGLSQLGYHVTILTSEPSYPNKNIYKDSVFWDKKDLEKDVIRFKTRTRKYKSNLLRRLLLYLEMTYKFIRGINRLTENYDIVIATTPAIFVGLAGIHAKKKLKCRFILDVRDLWPDSFIGIGKFTYKPVIAVASYLEIMMYKSADRIIINSDGFRSHIVECGINDNKISSIPNSLTDLELSSYIEEYNEGEDNYTTVIYTGNIGLAQDIELLIEVALHLKNHPKIKIIIIGYGYRYQIIENLIKELGLKNIQLLRAKSKTEVNQFIKKADISFVSLVNNSVFDKVLPGKIVDYMGLGKPVVGAVSGYAKHVIDEAKCGFVSVNRDAHEISNFMIKLADNKDLRLQMGLNGHQYAVKHYSWDLNILILKEILESVEKEYGEKGMHVRLESLHQ